jgi:hypothetical protein
MLSKFALLLTVVMGTLAGYVDLNVTEVQRPAVLIMSFACLLGASHPNGAWRRALVLGLSVPLAHVIAHVTGATLPYAMDHAGSTLLALIPAFVGSYLGVGMRRLWAAQHKEQSRP